MKVSKLHNKKLKILAGLAVVIFSFVVLSTGSIAWFLQISSQLNEGESFPVKNLSGKFKKVSIHTLNTSKSTSTTYKFNGSEAGSITMDWNNMQPNPYSGTSVLNDLYTIDAGDHPLLFIYELTQEITVSTEDTVLIEYATESTYVADGEESEGQPVVKIAAEHNPLSSIACFDSKHYPANQAGSITGISSYSSADGTFNYDKSSLNFNKKFVDLTDDGKEITYNDFDHDLKVFEGTTDQKINYVAVIMNYDVLSIEYIYNYYLGNDVLDNEVLKYDCDWVTEL